MYFAFLQACCYHFTFRHILGRAHYPTATGGDAVAALQQNAGVQRLQLLLQQGLTVMFLFLDTSTALISVSGSNLSRSLMPS